MEVIERSIRIKSTEDYTGVILTKEGLMKSFANLPTSIESVIAVLERHGAKIGDESNV